MTEFIIDLRIGNRHIQTLTPALLVFSGEGKSPDATCSS